MLHPPPVLAFYFICKRCDSQLSPMKSHHKTNVDVRTQKILQDVDPFFSHSRFSHFCQRNRKKSGTFGTKKEAQKKNSSDEFTELGPKRRGREKQTLNEYIEYSINKNHA